MGPNWRQKAVCSIVANKGRPTDRESKDFGKMEGSASSTSSLYIRGAVSLSNALRSIFHDEMSLGDSPLERGGSLKVKFPRGQSPGQGLGQGQGQLCLLRLLPHSSLDDSFSHLRKANRMPAERRPVDVVPVYLPLPDVNLFDQPSKAFQRFWEPLLQKLARSPVALPSERQPPFPFYFPLLLLSYVDLIDLPDLLVQLLTSRKDLVVIFAPEIVMDRLLSELVASLQRLNAQNGQARRNRERERGAAPAAGADGGKARSRHAAVQELSSLSDDSRRIVKASSLNVRRSASLNDQNNAGNIAIHNTSDSDNLTSEPASNSLPLLATRRRSVSSGPDLFRGETDGADHSVPNPIPNPSLINNSTRIPELGMAAVEGAQLPHVHNLAKETSLSVGAETGAGVGAGTAKRRPLVTCSVERPVYHAIMAAVSRVQQEEAVSIAVFI